MHLRAVLKSLMDRCFLQSRTQSRWPDRLACAVLAALALLAALTFRDYGLGWDDYTHAQYGDLLLSLYSSGFHDTRALSFVNLYLYGGGFDMAAELLAKIAAVRPVRDAAAVRRRGRHCRHCRHLADRPADRRPARRTAGAAAARGLPALLRAHVHESEGCAVRCGDGAVPARPGSAARPISSAMADTLFIVGLGFGLSIGSRIMAGFGVIEALGALALLFAIEAREGMPAAAAATRPPAARADSERHPGLRGDGADLAVGRGQSAQPVLGRSKFSRISSRSRGGSCSTACCSSRRTCREATSSPCSA